VTRELIPQFVWTHSHWQQQYVESIISKTWSFVP